MKLMMIDLDGTLFDTRMVNYLAYHIVAQLSRQKSKIFIMN